MHGGNAHARRNGRHRGLHAGRRAFRAGVACAYPRHDCVPCSAFRRYDDCNSGHLQKSGAGVRSCGCARLHRMDLSGKSGACGEPGAGHAGGTVMYAFTLGLRSLAERRKQYVRLFLVCMVGTGFSLFSLFLVKGMLNALTSKAEIYYGGDYQFMGGSGGILYINDTEDSLRKIQSVFPRNAVVSPRIDYDASYAALFFEGEAVRQRIIKAVDFTEEKALFSKLTFTAGNADIPAGASRIVLSKPIADMLGVRPGDTVTLMFSTMQGWTNTVQLAVQGVFRDSSLFGMYTSYVDLAYFRSAYGAGSSWSNRIVVSLPHAPSAGDTASYRRALETRFHMVPLTEKKQFYSELGGFSEPTYALIPLDANLADVQVLIDAMTAIVAFVTVMLLRIIVAGVGSTYRVIVMKRINEIGIYRAVGMRV